MKKKITKASDKRRSQYIRVLLQKDSKELNFCVLGAGHGGLAMAGHLALNGFRVNLYNRGRKRIRTVIQRKGIKVEGEVKGFGKIEFASNNIKECLKETDILMVVVPAVAHRFIAQTCAPYLKEHQIVVLNPGRTGGVLEFYNVLKEHGIKRFPFIAEAQTFLYASRALGPAHAKIFSIKNTVPLATLPAYWIPGVLKVVNRAFPQFIPGDNIFKTSFENIGAVFHPALTILNAGWIEETHGDFEYYVQGASESIAQVLEKLDKERLEVAAALGIKVMSAKRKVYGVNVDDQQCLISVCQSVLGDHRSLGRTKPGLYAHKVALRQRLCGANGHNSCQRMPCAIAWRKGVILVGGQQAPGIRFERSFLQDDQVGIAL